MGNNLVSSSMLQEEDINLISSETGFSAAQVERLYMRFKSLDKSGICGSLSREDFLRVPELAINPLCDRIVHMFFVDCDDDHERINFRQFMKVLSTFRSSARQPSKSRNVCRKDSIQSIFSSLSQNRFRHSRHSSCDGFFNYYPVQHHMTNQHSIHYVASTTHIPSNNVNNINNNHYGISGAGSGAISNGCGQFKKPYPISQLLDDDEPTNSRKQKMYFMFKIYDVDNDDRISLDDLKQILQTMVGKYISEAKLQAIAEKALRKADKNHTGYIEFDEFCAEFLHRDIDDLLRVKFSSQADGCGSAAPKALSSKSK